MLWFTLLSSHSTKETNYLLPEKVWRYPLVGLDSGMNAILLLPWTVWLWEGQGEAVGIYLPLPWNISDFCLTSCYVSLWNRHLQALSFC